MWQFNKNIFFFFFKLNSMVLQIKVKGQTQLENSAGLKLVDTDRCLLTWKIQPWGTLINSILREMFSELIRQQD